MAEAIRLDSNLKVAASIFEAMADPVLVIDFHGDELSPAFRYANSSACRLLKRTLAEIQTMRPGQIDEIDPVVKEQAYETLIQEGRVTFETLFLTSDGERIPMEINASDATLDGRRVCIAVARSLVARKEAARLLLQAKEDAEAANRAKSEFLATMSHEIRTPLHGVIGFASLLEGQDLPSEYREAVDGIRGSANLLLALVTDVLDFSRIEAGLLELKREPVDLRSLCHRLATAFRLRAEENGLSFHYQETSLPDGYLLTDPLRVEQIVGNLLSNALKFTERGQITFEVNSRRLSNSDEYEITLLVRDTGIGIREEHIPRLFHRFSQVDTSATRRHSGSGLGLVIVKKLCELMGGTTTVDTRYGHGSTFIATLRGRSAPAPKRPSDSILPEAVADVSLRILVAEDHQLNRRLMQRMLARFGYEADFASQGREACLLAASTEYDLIFMDVNMPEISGLEATEAIRYDEKSRGRSPTFIVALTAGVSEEERRACTTAGMDDFLGKPFTAEGLLEILSKARKRPA